jgi:MSHA biogenesis protein MshQ
MARSPRVLALLTLVPAVLLPDAFLATPAAAWYDTDWGYRKPVTLDATRVEGSDHADFPVMLSLVDGDLRTVANGGRVENASGFDIVVVDGADTVRLDHEMEHFDPATGEIVLWVRIPVLSATVDTDLFLYYGNASVAGSLENPAGVWTNGYEAVWHFGGDLLDATPNGRNGTNGGTSDTPALAGNGRQLVPISEVRTGTWSVSGSAITLQGWARYPAFSQDDPRIVSKAIAGNDNDHVFMLSLSGSGNRFPRLRIKTGTDDAGGTTVLIASTGGLSTDTWHLVAGSYDGTTMRLFTDGLAVGSTPKSGALRENAWETWIGNNPNNTTDPAWAAMDGLLDEVRVSSVARSAGWLRTEYNNLISPGTFHAVGGEETPGALALVKRAFLADGTPVAQGATLPRGTVVKFLLYVSNSGGPRPDLSLQDTLDPAFVYRAGTARIDTTAASCAGGACTPAEEAAIFAAVDARPPETDGVDGDAVSYRAATSTLHVGDSAEANAPLDVPGATVAAVLFEVTVQ